MTPAEKAESERRYDEAVTRMRIAEAEAAQRGAARKASMEALRLHRPRVIELAHEAIADRLKAPGTAEYAPDAEVSITLDEDNLFLLKTWVDAENSFGAKLRTHFAVQFRLEGETFVLTGLEDL